MALDNWQAAGIASFVSGPPQDIGFSTTTAVDTTGSPAGGARFDAATGAQANARFGEFTSARSPRQIQFSPRFLFRGPAAARHGRGTGHAPAAPSGWCAW